MTYHDCENYHDRHILQTIGTNKLAVVYNITCYCTIPMVADDTSVIGTLKQGDIQLKYKY